MFFQSTDGVAQQEARHDCQQISARVRCSSFSWAGQERLLLEKTFNLNVLNGKTSKSAHMSVELVDYLEGRITTGVI